MSEAPSEKRRYVFLSERTRNWYLWTEVASALIFVAFVLFIAFAWIGGFWPGLWYAIWHIQ